MSALTVEQLTQLRIATERLLELPEAAKWDARGHERRADEAQVKRAAFGLLNAANKAVGIRGLVGLVRQVEATADADGKLPSHAKYVVHTNLMTQIPNSVYEEHLPRIMEAMSRAALRSANAERELLGLEPIERLAKATFEYTSAALAFQQAYPELAGSVESFMVTAVGNHAQAITGMIVDAADPSSPIGIGPLQRKLRGEVSDLTVKRATRIARTETARVYGQTARGTFKQNGLTRVRLVTAGDPCSICEAIAARGFVDLDDLEDLPIHPNCRCDYIPDVKDWLPPKETITSPSAPGGPAEWPRFKTPPLERLADQPGYINANWYYKTSDVRPAAELLMKDPTKFNKALRSHKTAARLLNAVADSPRQETLYRGLHMPLKDIPKAWVKGGKVDTPLSSFTTSEGLAKGFATNFQPGEVRIVIELRNSRGLVLNNLKGPTMLDEALYEVIAAGKAKVISRETSGEFIRIMMVAE